MVVRLSDFLNTSFSTFSANDTNNTGITYPGAVVHNTTLTPGVGIGAGLDYQVETTNNNTETGMRLETVTTDVTAGSEDFDFVVKLMQNGATASEKFRVASTGLTTIADLSVSTNVAVGRTGSTVGLNTKLDVAGAVNASAFLVNGVPLSSGGVTTFSAGSTGFTPSSATSGAVTLAGTLAVGSGGTGQTSATLALAALKGGQRQSIATSGGTTTLTVSSPQRILFTGTSTQTVVLPVVSTLALGVYFEIAVVNTAGAVTVQSSGNNTITTIGRGHIIRFTCILITGTGTASWDWEVVGSYNGYAGNGSSVFANSPSLTNPTISGGSITGITDLTVADGGTGASDAGTARTNLGLAIGTNVQAYSARLADIAGLAPTADNFIVGNGTNWILETPASARTSLGLGTIATQASSSVSITGGSITGITDLAVADGGTGASDAGTARTNLGLAIGTNVQAYDADLAAIAALAGTSGLLKKTAADTWSLDTATYLTAAGNQTLTGGFNITPFNLGTGSGTVTPSAVNGNYQYITNNAAFTIATPPVNSAIDILVTNGATAGSITFSGYTVGAANGSIYALTSGNRYILSIREINGVATFSWYALQ